MIAGVNHARRTAIRRFRWHSTRVRQPFGHQNATVNRAPVRYRRAGGAKEPDRESWEKPPDWRERTA